MKKYVFVMIACLTSLSTIAEAQRVTIYFIPWQISTRTALSPDDVRRTPYVKTEILNTVYTDSFVRSLYQQPLEEKPKTPVRDIRLVIDIERRAAL